MKKNSNDEGSQRKSLFWRQTSHHLKSLLRTSWDLHEKTKSYDFDQIL